MSTQLTGSRRPPTSPGEGHTPPVQRQSSLPGDGGAGSQRPEPRKSLQERLTAAESLLSRSQSLKRGSNDVMQKTNEAFSGFWKLASKAASASYSKFNELKQSITTPIKNATSVSSLTRSQDELDRSSDRGSVGGGGGCEEDRASNNSSASGTIKERLRLNGSQDVLSTSESSYTESSGQRLSQTSFGENSLGR